MAPADSGVTKCSAALVRTQRTASPRSFSRRMRSVYDPVPLVDSEKFRERFLRAYRDWIRTGSAEAMTEFVIQAAGEPGSGDLLDAASQVLGLAAMYYLPFYEEDRLRFQQLFTREVELVIRNDGRG